MTKKCIGCGVTLQSDDDTALGYVKKEKIDEAEYCANCFKLIHYGNTVIKDKFIDFDKRLEYINSKGYPVLFLIDILNINDENLKYINLINNKKYIILSKYDILPYSVKEEKIVNYFKKNNLNIDYVVSAYNGYNVSKVFDMLKDCKYDNVFVLGFTNAGKSSLLNAFLKLKGHDQSLTTSYIPNTTIDTINVKIDGINFIDTPGFKYNVSLYNILDNKKLNKVLPKKRIKVRTFQVKDGDSIIIDDIVRIDYKGNDNSLNLYISNNLDCKKFKSKNKDYLFKNKSIEFNDIEKKDIVISGLGFIKINKLGSLKLYISNLDLISLRDKMI